LTIIDVYSREALAIEIGQRLRGEHVVAVLNRLVQQRGAPRYLFADNGAEFNGQMTDHWAYHHGVRIDFSRLGKPTDHAFIESYMDPAGAQAIFRNERNSVAVVYPACL
jgi:putative transposase